MERDRDFAPVQRMLRGEIIEHYRERGEPIDNAAGLRTLDTNSTLVPQRAELLLDLVKSRIERDSLHGLDVADLGCGFGALSLYFACAGARVVGVDPNRERFAVGGRVGEEFGLDVRFRHGWIEALPLPDDSLDLLVLNNSFCYVTDRSDRREALRHAYRAARSGACLVMRNPSVGSPLDPFTGLPLVHQMPQPLARPFLKLTRSGRRRSKVRMLPGQLARWELSSAGFAEVRLESPARERRPNRYQHLTAMRPLKSTAGPLGA